MLNTIQRNACQKMALTNGVRMNDGRERIKWDTDIRQDIVARHIKMAAESFAYHVRNSFYKS